MSKISLEVEDLSETIFDESSVIDRIRVKLVNKFLREPSMSKTSLYFYKIGNEQQNMEKNKDLKLIIGHL